MQVEPGHHPEKKEFQLERLILFTDAVFAIAITLLVIEIHLPPLTAPLTETHFLQNLELLLPKFGGFIVSFFIIGLYWAIHHKMFGFVVNYNARLIWLNLLFLFTIVLMPFSTAVYSEYSTPEYIHLISPFAVYVANIVATSAMHYWLWSYISNPKNALATHLPPASYISRAKLRSVLLASIFILSLLVSVWVPGVGRMLLFLIPFAMTATRERKKGSPKTKR